MSNQVILGALVHHPTELVDFQFITERYQIVSKCAMNYKLIFGRIKTF